VKHSAADLNEACSVHNFSSLCILREGFFFDRMVKAYDYDYYSSSRLVEVMPTNAPVSKLAEDFCWCMGV
jgi:hypothetical protein